MTTSLEQAPGVFFQQQQGVPQGGPFSPLLFNLNINDMMKNIPPEVTPSLYVDDLMVLTPPAIASSIIAKIKRDANEMGMEINYGHGKTEIINPTGHDIETHGIREVK